MIRHLGARERARSASALLRRVLVALAVVLSTTAVSWCLAAPSWASDPSISVQLTPSTILADGTSTTQAVATVPGNGGGDSVTFSSSDPNETVGSTTDNGDGTYSTAITSSTTAGQVTITATDSSNLTGQATLTQVAGPAANISVVLQPNSIVADGVSQTSATATVTDAHGNRVAGDSVSFVRGDTNQPIAATDHGDGTYTATLTSSTTAGQVTITATDGAITSAQATLTETNPPNPTPSTPSGPSGPSAPSQDTTSTSLRASSAAVKVNARETYTAVVGPSHAGALAPSGTVSFLDGGHQIAGCAAQTLASTGSGTASASCSVSYARQGSHTITAVYGGDANFTGSSSAASAVGVQPLGRIGATMRWIFVSGASYTKVLSLLVRGAPSGSQVLVTCHGGGCPFATSSLVVPTAKQCLTKSKSTCSVARAVDLSGRFAKRRLRPGARITVAIVESGWLGRSYTFVMRARRPPHTASGCVADGSSAPTAC